MTDLDGTLIDTTYLHTVAWWRALDEAGHTVPMVVINPLIGMGGDELLHELLGRTDDAISDAHDRHFKEIRTSLRALPGATDFLARAGAEADIILVTSAKEDDLPVLLAPLGGDGAFADVVHSDMVDRSKPHPDLFGVALERAGARPESTLAVGDARWDVHAAESAGVACVGIATGGTPASALAESGAVAVYRHLPELLGRWASSPFARLPVAAGA